MWTVAAVEGCHRGKTLVPGLMIRFEAQRLLGQSLTPAVVLIASTASRFDIASLQMLE